MSWTVVNAAQGYASGSGSSIASNENTGQTLNVAVGDLLFVSVAFFLGSVGSVTVADTAGNTFTFGTLVFGTDGGSGNIYVIRTYYCVATASHASDVVTVTLDDSVIQKGCVVYQCQATNTITSDVSATKVDNVGASSITSNSFTTAEASEIIFFAAHSSWGNSAGFYNVGTGYTFHANGVTDTWGLAVQYQIVSSIQTGVTTDMSADSAGTWQAVVFSFQEVAGGKTFLLT